jgi:uncharacterized membrane protein
MLMPIHIAAGGLAIVLGAVALSVKKGGTLHRRSGVLFVYAMLVMGTTASLIAFLKSPTDPQVRSGFMVAYFVVTAWMTVRPATAWTRRIQIVALVAALFSGSLALAGAVKIFNVPGRVYEGIPFFIPLLLGTVLMLAAAGDVRVLRSGMPKGAPRLTRHLWRMCFALFIAAASFFSIRERVARVLPEPFTTAPMRVLPIVLIFGAMFYWLWKLRRRGRVASRVE